VPVLHHIEFVSRDRTGIVSVVTPSGVFDAETAVEEIRAGRAVFYAGPTPHERSIVRAQDAFGGTYLYANWDGTKRNNLHELAPRFATPPSRPGVRRPAPRGRDRWGVMLDTLLVGVRRRITPAWHRRRSS
jgi:hypothetical protein